MMTTSGRRRSASEIALSPSRCLADHADVGRAGEREAESLSDDLVVVGDQAGDFVTHTEYGVVTSLSAARVSDFSGPRAA